jgi:hypothetical protein
MAGSQQGTARSQTKVKFLKPETAMKFFDAVHGVNNTQSKMGRPSTVDDGVKLNLYVPRAAKRQAFQLSMHEGKSISAIFTEMILARADEKLAKEVLAPDTPAVSTAPPA